MYSTAHLAAGLIIGKLTGDYPTAIISSTAIDLDHLIPYFRKGKLKSVKSFLNAAQQSEDSSRTFLHGFIAWGVISGLIYLINPAIGAVFSLGILGHFLLDAVDDSDFFPFFPIKKLNTKGFVGYFSKTELVITIFLFLLYFII